MEGIFLHLKKKVNTWKQNTLGGEYTDGYN